MNMNVIMLLLLSFLSFPYPFLVVRTFKEGTQASEEVTSYLTSKELEETVAFKILASKGTEAFLAFMACLAFQAFTSEVAASSEEVASFVKVEEAVELKLELVLEGLAGVPSHFIKE